MMRNHSTVATPPGATIQEQLTSKGLTQNELATRIGLSQDQLDRLIKGELQLTNELALKLENALGVPAQFWINLEAVYHKKIQQIQQES